MQDSYAILPVLISVSVVCILLAVGIMLISGRLAPPGQQEPGQVLLQPDTGDGKPVFSSRDEFEELLSGRIDSKGEFKRFALLHVELESYADLLACRGEVVAEKMEHDFSVALTRAITEALAFTRIASGSFLVLAPRLDSIQLAAIMVNIRNSFASSPYARDYGQWSLGLSHYPDAASSCTALIRVAQSQTNRYMVTYRKAVNSPWSPQE